MAKGWRQDQDKAHWEQTAQQLSIISSQIMTLLNSEIISGSTMHRRFIKLHCRIQNRNGSRTLTHMKTEFLTLVHKCSVVVKCVSVYGDLNESTTKEFHSSHINIQFTSINSLDFANTHNSTLNNWWHCMQFTPMCESVWFFNGIKVCRSCHNLYLHQISSASVSAFFEVQSTTVNNFHYDSKYDTFSDYQKSH